MQGVMLQASDRFVYGNACSNGDGYGAWATREDNNGFGDGDNCGHGSGDGYGAREAVLFAPHILCKTSIALLFLQNQVLEVQ